MLPSGALELDRRWALRGAGGFVNGKRFPGIHLLPAQYDLPAREVTLDGRTFALDRQGDEIARWCGARIGEPVAWVEDADRGFPDDTDAPGPTLVSSASVAAVAAWFDLDVAATRLRFRTNIEIGGTDAFWEDALYGAVLRAGAVEIEAVNPCQRCVVPTRDARTGEVLAGFQKRFAQLREAHLRAGTSTTPFTHYYCFAVNTRIGPRAAGKVIRVGDRCEPTRA